MGIATVCITGTKLRYLDIGEHRGQFEKNVYKSYLAYLRVSLLDCVDFNGAATNTINRRSVTLKWNMRHYLHLLYTSRYKQING